jgi:beta-lactamase regulating signal transducer with metallopeptidase domain
MNEAAALIGYALVLGVVAPIVLRRAAWVTRAPRLAIGMWLAFSVSWLLALALAGLAMAAPWLQGSLAPGTVSRSSAAGEPMAVAGAVLTVGVVSMAGFAVAREVMRRRAVQRAHAAGLARLGRAAPELGAVIVDHATPAAYCLPRGRSRVVITTGALRLLDDDQLRAVLAHERAHLRERHHLVSAIASGLGRGFGVVPLLDHGRHEIGTLIELAADDAAARRHGGMTLAAALLSFARASAADGVGVQAATLGAGAHAVVQRIERMLDPPRPLCKTVRAAGAATAIGAVALPVGVACTSLAVLAAVLVV